MNDDSFWGKYPQYQDIAKLRYGRILWRSVRGRALLLSNWENPLHPHAQRFERQRLLIEELMESNLSEKELDAALRLRDLSLRAAVREIPSVFGSL